MRGFTKLVEEKISEAMANGEFDNLPGRGKPLDLEEDSHIPVELRMAYRILKRSGVPPEEVMMAKHIHTIRSKIVDDPDLSEEERLKLKRQLNMMDLELNMKLERFRKQFSGI